MMKLKQAGIGLVVALALVGCNNNDRNTNDANRNNINDNGGVLDGRNGNNGNRHHGNVNDVNRGRSDVNRNGSHYNVNKEAADRIVSEVPGIDRAYVLTTKNTAYVAAGTDGNYGNNSNGTGGNTAGNNGNATGSNTALDNGHAGNNSGSMTGNNNGGIHGGANNAGTGGTNGTVNNGSGKNLTDHEKRQISRIVKSVDPSINNVYVSTNPDFSNLAHNYSNDLDNGRPVGGFFDQLGNMIDRVFPGKGNHR